MAAVMIGIDPHKQTHQAVALDDREAEIGMSPVGPVRRRTSHSGSGKVIHRRHS